MMLRLVSPLERLLGSGLIFCFRILPRLDSHTEQGADAETPTELAT